MTYSSTWRTCLSRDLAGLQNHSIT
ncbi:unnamed protein product [Tuber melanosporum]|uniref:(Perigord truffle) hypothetical protein n=1 Tax=Tuber melanosporum (strain Mel28) TaxID=656061 RepID=D5GGX1_TUBMM|nr:unnamed protein product [Tuber melanosporum]